MTQPEDRISELERKACEKLGHDYPCLKLALRLAPLLRDHVVEPMTGVDVRSSAASAGIWCRVDGVEYHIQVRPRFGNAQNHKIEGHGSSADE